MIFARLRSFWVDRRGGSVGRRIFSAMMIIVAATAAVKLAAMGKDVLVAATFGLGDDFDAFLIAVLIPAFASSVIGLSFNGAFMPAYVRVLERDGPQAARRLFANVMVLNFALLSACAIALAVVADPLLRLVAGEFPPAKFALAHELFLLLLPLIVLEGQVSLWGAALNAKERFALAALSPILTPLIIVAFLLAAVPGIGVEGLAWGTLVGTAAELAVLGFALSARGLLPVPRWHRNQPDTRAVLGQYLPLVLSGAVMSGSTVVDQAMAAWLEPGSVAALNYGGKIPGVLAGIGITALGTAVLPYFSQLVATHQREVIIETLRTYHRWILLVSIPATLILIAGSEWMIRVLFERGAFVATDTALVARVQQLYLIQVPFVILGMIGVRLLVAMARNHLLTIMSSINFIVNVVGNLIFMRLFGVAGIALSTSLMYAISALMIFYFVRQSLRSMPARAVA